ncbi:MAG: hypothetical protein Q8927_15250 [Bacteroidota bacterium]|nr:hypothetical protein [Bacteroidota bacterium]
MKPITLLIAIGFGIFPLTACAQLNNGGLYANFGVDGDSRSNYLKYGILTGNLVSDDWFSGTSGGKNVIDTSNAAAYLSSLQSGNNSWFSKRMSVPLYSKVNGKLWLDAAYGRDYITTASLKDSTSFATACKNGDNPVTWNGGISNFPSKDDLVDVFAHMRRDGSTVNDSLWLFSGISTYGTTGARYYDVELYKNSFTYDPVTGIFSSAGPDAGHTQWLFDASGNIIQTGDMILAISFSPGSAPVVDVRIWVSQTTWSGVTPTHFRFNANFDGTGTFGYASIVSLAGATSFGAGISNYSATPAQDTTYATPWGTNSGAGWSPQFQSTQFIEVGLNVTRIGLDPALYTSLGPSACASLFSNIFFKSRASNSFTSSLHDFVIPLTFLRTPVMDYALQSDTLRCNRSVGTIQVTNNTTIGYYTWKTANGDIMGTNSDSSQINIDKPGTYILSSSPAQGCAPTRTDTIVVPIDTFPPVASVNITLPNGFTYLQLIGGDVNASNYSTPFGGSQGLLWNWSGPKSFTSTIQNPQTADTAWGTYQLIVTEKRNGCTDTATKTVSIYDFKTLLTSDLKVNGSYSDKSVILHWEDANQPQVESYEIEKCTGNNVFHSIGTVTTEAGNDYHPQAGDNVYRIKATAKSGQVYYSGIITVYVSTNALKSTYLTRNASGTAMTLVASVASNCRGTIAVYSITGQALWQKGVQLRQGSNAFELPAKKTSHQDVQVIALFIDGQITYSQKVIF